MLSESNKNNRMCLHPDQLLLVLLLAIFLNTAAAAAHSVFLQQGIAEEVLRFHVLANSDSEEDQAVKYLVRDAVLAWAAAELADISRTEETSLGKSESANQAEISVGESESANQVETSVSKSESANQAETPVSEAGSSGQTGAFLTKSVSGSAQKAATLEFYEENLCRIESIANTILAEQGMPYQATAEICQSYFPDRTYGDCTFPAGWYQALRIRLGDAKGQNWWCLLYPSLCFGDVLHAVVDEESLQTLEETLTVEEYQSLLKTPSSWKVTFKWFDF